MTTLHSTTTPSHLSSNTASPRIAIAGITGRLGKLCAQEAASLLIGGLSRAPKQYLESPYWLTDNADKLSQKADVIIDVSHENLVIDHADIFSRNKTAWVLGTTGLNKNAQKAVEDAAKKIPVLQAANFSPALTLLLELAQQLSSALPDYDAEILEIHHRNKQDAPSGTALAIGRAVAQGRGHYFDDVARFNQNGKRIKNAIGFASLRGGQVVGEHDLKFLSDDEEITLSHRALDRRIFAKGAVKAALWLAQKERTPGLYHMRDMLFAQKTP